MARIFMPSLRKITVLLTTIQSHLFDKCPTRSLCILFGPRMRAYLKSLTLSVKVDRLIQSAQVVLSHGGSPASYSIGN